MPPRFRRRTFRRFRRAARVEVSQFRIGFTLTVAPTTITAPFLSALVLLGFPAMIQTGVAGYQSWWKGITVKGINYSSAWFLGSSPVDGANAYANIAESIAVDQFATGSGSTPARIPNLFTSQVGSIAPNPVTEITTFPRRTLYRRWALMPIGSQNAATFNQQVGLVDNANANGWPERRLRTRARLSETDGLWFMMNVHNPTVGTLTISGEVRGVISYTVHQ